MRAQQCAKFICLLLIATSLVSAQINSPHVGYVYPAGGRQGTTFDVTVGGQFLEGARLVLVSGGGVEATVIEVKSPLNPKQLNDIRDRLQKLVGNRNPGAAQQQLQGQQQRNPAERRAIVAAMTPEELKEAQELRDKIADTTRRRAIPALANTVTIRVTIAASTPPGERELRLVAAQGMTNPVVFCVDQLPEVSKQPQLVPLQLAAGGGNAVSEQARPLPAAAPIEVTLPSTLNGQIMPGGIDRYRFHATQGQKLVVVAKARALVPYISDAVPGWFQPAVSIVNANGREVASADHYRFAQDPVLMQEIPASGDYVLQVHDSIYRGREDFVYRIAIGELPIVTGVFPLGGRVGKKVDVDLNGWNLPLSKFRTTARREGMQLIPVQSTPSLSVPFVAGEFPETVEIHTAVSARNAKRLKLPIVINGRIARPGESATFRIDGRAGEEIVAEIVARRMNSPLDSVITLTDASGKHVASDDDFDDKAAALLTHHADSRLSVKLPAKGSYYLRVSDAQHHGGPDFAYRLRVSYPQPDFSLRMIPSTVNLRPGMSVAVRVNALRQDGFEGEIKLALAEVPAGLVLSGGAIPANQESVRVTLTATAQASNQPHKLSLIGEASIAGRTVRRDAIGADDMMQAFAWHHLVPAKESYIYVFGGARRNAMFRVPSETLKLHAGRSGEFRINAPAQLAEQLQIALNDAPDGLSIQETIRESGGLIVRLRSETKIKPGTRGNLIFDASIPRPINPSNPNPGAVNRMQPLGTLPAIPFEVVE